MIYDTISPTAEKIILNEGKTWLTSEELSRRTCRKALFGFGENTVTKRSSDSSQTPLTKWGTSRFDLPSSSQQDSFTNDSSNDKVRGCYVHYNTDKSIKIEDWFLLQGKHGVHIRKTNGKTNGKTTLWRFQNEDNQNWKIKFAYWFANINANDSSSSQQNIEVKLWVSEGAEKSENLFETSKLQLDSVTKWNMMLIKTKSNNQKMSSAAIQKQQAKEKVKNWLTPFENKKGEWLSADKDRCDSIKNERSPDKRNVEIAREWCTKDKP